ASEIDLGYCERRLEAELMDDRFNDKMVELVPVWELVDWVDEPGPGRLLLPPIQRNADWRNDQIIDYWDSLLRGYPAGMMLVHRSRAEGDPASTSDGVSVEARASDYLLFDGQQRVNAIRLGFGEGQLKSRLKLWVDLGAEPS